ncbi:MAG: zf-HC2 domain-containing protein [Bacteroidales bacterium]
MDEKDLKRLLHVRERTGGRAGWRCPDAARLAAYVEHNLSARAQARIESHVSDCAACLDQVAFLARHAAAGSAAVSPQLLSRAQDVVPSRAWPMLVPRWAAVAVTTACLLLVVSIGLRQPGAPPLPGAATPTRSPAVSPDAPAALPVTPTAPAVARNQPVPAPPATVRKSVPQPLALHLLSPAENSTLSPREPEFRWQPVPGAIYYEIQVLAEEGDVVWQAKLEGTSTRLPNVHPLRSGTKYFVWIRAHLSGGGSVKSAAVAFRVGGS